MMDADFLDNGTESVAKIIVIGVGGGGNNAVNRMIDDNISSVDFYVANTDCQVLSRSKAQNRIVLGEKLTRGLGAGGNPDIGRQAAEESEDKIREIVKGANLVFIAAGMGGGTGTGAAPVIARIAREEGALTIAIVTRPFTFEGAKRTQYSVEGLNELKNSVDSIVIVSNDKLLMVNGSDPLGDAFAQADDVLSKCVKTVTDLILVPSFINLDFADIKNTLKDAGQTLIGFGMGSGENRATDAANNAMNSPLIETSIIGARRAICHVTVGKQVSLYEAHDAADKIVEAAGNSVDLKFGLSINPELNDEILVSLIAADYAEEYVDPEQKEEQISPFFGEQPQQNQETEEAHSFIDDFFGNK